jgi:hypothetical protein
LDGYKTDMEENSWIAQKMEFDLQGHHDGQCGLSLSGDHLDLVGSDAARERLKPSRSASLPSSPAMKKVAGPGTWTTPTSVLVDGFASPAVVIDRSQIVFVLN